MKADVDRELRQARISMQQADDLLPHNKDREKNFRRASRHLDRLETAKSQVEARIAVLSKIVSLVFWALTRSLLRKFPLQIHQDPHRLSKSTSLPC